MTEFVWNPAEHATWCPQHRPPPPDGGGSSWLCCCSGALNERADAAGSGLVGSGREPGPTQPGKGSSPETVETTKARSLSAVAAEDRAATVHLYGEAHVEALEREANRG